MYARMYIQTAYDLYDLTKLVVQRHRFEQLSLHLYIHRKYSCRKITRNYTFDYSQASKKFSFLSFLGRQMESSRIAIEYN